MEGTKTDGGEEENAEKNPLQTHIPVKRDPWVACSVPCVSLSEGALERKSMKEMRCEAQQSTGV